jgi:hypothetical protein
VDREPERGEAGDGQGEFPVRALVVGAQQALDAGHELSSMAAGSRAGACGVGPNSNSSWNRTRACSASASRRGSPIASAARSSAICSRSMRTRRDSHHTTGW